MSIRVEDLFCTYVTESCDHVNCYTSLVRAGAKQNHRRLFQWPRTNPTASLGECTFFVAVLLKEIRLDHNLCSAVMRVVRFDVSGQSVGPLKMKPLRCPETSVANYQATARSIPDAYFLLP